MTEVHHKQRIYTILGVAMAMFLGALDQTIVSTAMPRIVADLGGLNRYTWITTVYLMVSTLLVPIYGKLSDIVARKTIELWSIGLFLTGSVLSGLAGELKIFSFLGDGMSQLVVFRAVQGLGGAGIFALAFIIIADLYPPRERGKIAGVFGSVFGLASIVGPLIGGFLTDHATGWIPGVEGWRWVFYVNLPLGAIALWFIITRMPRLHPHDHSHKFNYVSAILMIIAFLPMILALQLDKTVHPWNSPEIITMFSISALFIAVWIWHSLKFENPIMNLRLFRNKIFARGILGSFMFGGGFMPVIIFLPLYMQNVQGVSATNSGFSMIPLMIGIVGGAGVSGALASRIGRYKFLLVGGAFIALVGAILLSTLGVSSPYGLVVGFMIVTGLGFGPAQSMYNLAIQNAVSDKELGQATSSVQFGRQIGSVIGAAVMGALLSSALTTAFETNLGSMSAQFSSQGGSSQSEMQSGGLNSIRSTVENEFDKSFETIKNLFAARGTAAETQLKAVLANPNLPDAMKNGLKNGTPSMAIDAQFGKLSDSLKGIVLSGNAPVLNRFITGMSSTATGQNSGLGDVFSPDLLDYLTVAVGLPAAQRQEAWTQISQHLDEAKTAAEDTASSAALEAVRVQFQNLKTKTANEVVQKIKQSFADAIHQVWFAAIFVAIMHVLVTFFIPSIPLRGKGEDQPEIPGALSH